MLGHPSEAAVGLPKTYRHEAPDSSLEIARDA